MSEIPQLALVGNTIQLSKDGPLIKNNAGAIESRNAGDTDYQYLRCKSPVATNDAVTLGFANSAYLTGTATTLYRILYATGANTFAESSSIVTDASGNLIVSTGGKLGIGVTPSTYQIEVNGVIQGNSDFRVGNRLRFTPGGTERGVTWADATAMYWEVAGSEKMRLLNSGGALLINTTTALTTGDLLSVNGPATFAGDVIQTPSTTVTPTDNGTLMVEATSNTQLTFKYKGSDGTVRSNTLTLA